MEKLARIYDAEILPVWSQRFGQLMLRGLAIPPRSQILDVACGTGYPTSELIRRKDDATRLIAIEASSALLDVARKKLEESGAEGVFLRSQAAEPRLSFADDVYDLVVCNVALAGMKDPAATLRDFARVTRVGGEVRATLPLAGSFSEFFDIYREVLVKHDKHDTAARLNGYIETRYPTVQTCQQWLDEADLDGDVDVEEFTLLFRSSREFFFAPVIEYGPLAEWKAIAGTGREMQDVFWYIKEGIDAYFDGRAFEVTIRAGCLRGRRRPRDTAEDSVSSNSQSSIGRRPGSEAETEDPDTLDPDTDDFGSTLEGLPYIKPLGDVEDTKVPGLPPSDDD